MTAHDPSLARQTGGILGWLGLNRNGVQAAESDSAAEAPPSGRHCAVRQRQLDEICAFLTFHELEVNARNLAIAHDYLSGNDPHLVRAIDRQMQERKPITAQWLNEIVSDQGNDSGNEMEALSHLMSKLEHSIDEFGKTSHDARKATSEYSSALENHVGDLEQVSRTGEMISELATITKVMLNRTRTIEEQMHRSEEQTKTLKKRLDEAKRSAEEDHLTGLPNRRAFESRFEQEYRQARANAEPLCVAFCDIDFFKKVNDTHGHDAGDRVLKLVADNLSAISNDRCHVARHGGEEFVLLFRDASILQAFEKLDKLRDNLSERRLINRATDQPFGQITISGGIADVFACGDPRAALKAADKALYRAKQEGRNRILIADGKDCSAKHS